MKRRFHFATPLAAAALFMAASAGAQDKLPPLHPAGEIMVEEEIPAQPPPNAPETAAEPAAASPGESPAPAAGAEKPSAELIIDAEEAVATEPALQPGEEPLPPVDSSIPGDMNIFGTDLFGPTPGMDSGPADFAPPPRLPDLQDPQEQQRKMRVRFRQIKARLDRDPQLVELQAMAEAARTPEDRRAARRAYYTALFERARNIDKSLTNYTETLERAALARLGQTRIEPTVPNNPPPPPLPQAKFMPTPQYPQFEPAAEEPVALP